MKSEDAANLEVSVPAASDEAPHPAFPPAQDREPSRTAIFLKRWLPKGLRARLLGLVGLSLCLPVLLLSVIFVFSVRRSLFESASLAHREIAQRVGDRVTTHVGNVKKTLLTLSSQGKFAAMPESVQSAGLREIMVNYPSLRESAVLSPAGIESVKIVRRGIRVVASADRINRSNRDEFLAPKNGREYTGPVFFTQRDRTPQMFIAVPLGARQGALLARLSLDNVWDLISELTVGQTGRAYIVDRQGNLIAHPQRERVLAHENWMDKPVVANLLQAQWRERREGAVAAPARPIFKDEEGRPVLATSHWVPDLGWGVIVESPMAEVMAPVAKLWGRMGLLLLLAGGGLLFLSLSLTKKILEPLQVLQEGVQGVAQGKLHQNLVIHTDDEIQRLAEEFNKMAQSLEHLEQTKRDLTHMIVHDLKSPLSGVLGSLEYVLSGAPGSVNADQKKLLSLGVKSGKDLLRMIQNLLDLAKMEEGRFEIKREPVSLLEIAGDCVDDLEANIHREGKSISVEMPKNMPKIYADRDLLHRVLANLLTNALKHTLRGAELAIRARLSEDGKSAVLSVKDTGEGIPKEYLTKIFEKFSQADARKQRFRVGVGLGLAFCKLAVEAHGGRIWVESEVGMGSEFFVELPLVQPPAEDLFPEAVGYRPPQAADLVAAAPSGGENA